MICKNCGNICPDGEKFCNNCGSQLDTAPVFTPPVVQVAPENNASSVPSQKKKGKGALIAVIAVLATLIVAVGVVFALHVFEVIDLYEIMGIEDDADDKDDDEDDDEDKDDNKDDDKDEDKDKDEDEDKDKDEPASRPVDTDEPSLPPPASDVKIGFIYLHDENSTYDKNIMEAAKAACKEMGVEYAQKTHIPESSACYDAAVELIEVDGCDIIFADSFGHESYLMKAAEEYPLVQFCHATGTQAHTSGLDNFHNAYAAIHEGRYLTGVAAGMKLNEMIENGEITAEEAKMGFVGSFLFAEVISGYTAFYLGAKSVCPTVTMDVKFVDSWYDEYLEKEAARELINNGCVLISQYSDSWGAPTACEAAGVPNISYNGSTMTVCPDTYLVGSRIDWTPYFKYIIECVQNDEEIAVDWAGTIETGSVVLSQINDDVAAEGTEEKLDEVAEKLADGTMQVFDTSTFTVDGEYIDSYIADVDTDYAFTPDTEVVEDGIIYESRYRSAPYFDLEIDGITLLDRNYGD